jgi:hypothetical protein
VLGVHLQDLSAVAAVGWNRMLEVVSCRGHRIKGSIAQGLGLSNENVTLDEAGPSPRPAS